MAPPIPTVLEFSLKDPSVFFKHIRVKYWWVPFEINYSIVMLLPFMMLISTRRWYFTSTVHPMRAIKREFLKCSYGLPFLFLTEKEGLIK